jgi:hypothetical protein
MKILITFGLLVLLGSISAQVTDDFSDGNLTGNPTWTGDLDDFIVNGDLELQLNAVTAGNSELSTSSVRSDSTEWLFRIKLAFSPSTNNFARIYLISNQPELDMPLEGYFLQLGESGANDAIELFEQTGPDVRSVCRGIEGAIAGPFDLRVNVRYSNNGKWTIFSAPAGSQNFIAEAIGYDTIGIPGGFFGISCTYTNSNNRKFFFDDLVICPIVPDTVPPAVSLVSVISPTQLDVHFSEAVDPGSAGMTRNYLVESVNENPLQATPDQKDPSVVHLFFESGFANGTSDQLLISGIYDQEGNTMEPASILFAYFEAGPFDILIHEIMADPDPAVCLPVVEYLELYNHTKMPVSLNNWSIETGGNAKSFPDITLPAERYLLITKGDELNDYGPCVPLFNSVYTLGNEGTSVRILDQYGRLIHSVSYSSEWYFDEWKSMGGWSLEMIDPGNPCEEEENWKVSVDPSGGTPGRMNSVLSANPDTTAPRLHHIGVAAHDLVRLWYSEKMDSISIQDPSCYSMSNDLGAPYQTSSTGDDYHSVYLKLNLNLSDTAHYFLNTVKPVFDCTGNPTNPDDSISFGIPHQALYMDLIINEILVDPKSDGVDFVEIYNRTGRYYDLSHLVLASVDTVSMTLINVRQIALESFIMAPGEYFVLTTDPAAIVARYSCPDRDAFVRMEALPAFGNEAGNVVLARNSDGLILDRVDYTKDLHFALISDTEGVSLERINFDRPSGDPGNWHSASETAGFATPGYLNSQFSSALIAPEDPFTVDPELFTPDNDGSGDVLNIRYRFPGPGNMVSILIFDAQGRLVKTLINNVLAGTEGSFSWDGSLDRAGIGMDGIYIILAEFFNLEGKTAKYRKSCVLRRLNSY